jgi:hypothetical protein
MRKILSVLALLFVGGCCGINQQRVSDIIDDINDNLSIVRTEENTLQVDYIKTRIKHLEDELNANPQ